MHFQLHPDTSSFAVGTTMGLAAVAVPDEVVSFLGKVLLGVLVAFVSASVHALSKQFWGRVFNKKDGT